MNGADQAATLRRLSGGPSGAITPRRPRVVSVTGGKGGVGKSTVALNLAVSWAARGARTLAFDGDMGMADLNLLLGLAPTRSLIDVLEGAAIEDVLVAAHGIHLLPALNGSYRLANLDNVSRTRLLERLAALGSQFDTLVIDTPAGIGANAIGLAGAAPEVLVVATPEPLSLADAYACLKVLVTRQRLTHAYLVPNAVRSPSEADEVCTRLVGLVDRFLGISLSPLPPIPHDASVAEAAAAGIPLALYRPDSPAARALKQLARRLDVLVGEGEAPAGAAGKGRLPLRSVP